MAHALKKPVQETLFPAQASRPGANRLASSDRPVHDWYRFVLSFPAHLVREYIDRFGLDSTHTLLDPFCGTGTTLVEAKLAGICSVGTEANPMTHFASRVKTSWRVDADGLVGHAAAVAQAAERMNRDAHDIRTLPEETLGLLLRDSISPLPLHKSLVLLDAIRNAPPSHYRDHELLALAKTVVLCSNLHFGPEVGVSKHKKTDASVFQTWLAQTQDMAEDLRFVTARNANSSVICADARNLDAVLSPNSVDAVFTSPPYPNEKDYTRTTRLESVILGFIQSKEELKALKGGLLRSNTRNVYKGDDDDAWISKNRRVQAIAERIEARRVELGKTSGFERLYAKVTRLYFGGMARHLAQLRPFLRQGAHLGYVVGDQASYFRVMIPTAQLLGEIAESLGYQVVSIDLFRTRLATATRQYMREEVLVLRWPGA